MTQTAAEFDRAAAIDRHLRTLLLHPTAPFREAPMLRAIDAFAAERAPRVRLRADRAGNRILTVRGARAGSRKPTIAFTAHLDHPAFVAGDDGRFELLGRVVPECLPGCRLRFFRADGARAGRGRAARIEREGSRIFASMDRTGGDPLPGDYAMFDFPALAMRGDRITARVCDDLLGAVAILITIDELLATEPTACILAAFTRAEEVGFVGALAMLEERTIPRALPIVGLECSAARGGNAVVGDGPIVRTGDRIATFDPAVTAFLRDCAEEISSEDRSFRYQRRLMQGGACESTAYLLDGRRAGALCLALGNYHNVPDRTASAPRPGLAAEYVSRRDLDGLVRLMVRASSRAAALRDPFAPTRDALKARLSELRRRL